MCEIWVALEVQGIPTSPWMRGWKSYIPWSMRTRLHCPNVGLLRTNSITSDLARQAPKKKGQKRPEPFNKFSSLFRIIYELYTKDTAKLPKMPLQCVQHTSFQPHVVFTIMRSKLFPKAVMDTWASVFQSVLLVLTDYPAGTVVLMGITATTATHFVEVEQDKYLTSKFDLKHNLIWSQLYRFMVQLSPLAMS